ncbi:endospore coat-associated protein YheC [Brevibacillus reuszeri]|uniref:YheC/YheD family endospore coat-associated protein n=1 Tax=Brevibacillus reuszeri TaxID=54915 RepID=UPI001B070DA9|nr:YheC/YheD family protein [Brevibacillus reuszeri]GIO09183.1 endospore coat-associated protein YheC [Brevibacillus reuszeri]
MRKRIGILTYRGETGFVEPGFLSRLVKEGVKMGAEVFLFSPQDVRYSIRQIRGYVPLETGWTSDWYDWPDIVIDRYRYYPLAKHSMYLPFRKQPWFRYANNRFSNKYRVHQVLVQDPELARWLPETCPYSKETLFTMLEQHRMVYLKPTNGTGGRSILRVERQSSGYVLHGRTKRQAKSRERLYTLADLCKRLESWMDSEKSGNEQFFLQQGLQLSLIPGRTVDARLLIQKDGSGEWRLTGMGIRIGANRSSTSNLHGGGSAVPAAAFLINHFGREEAERIILECKELALKTVSRIEKHYGQMMEFGFDLGIDIQGRVWIIEINPKPGREIFRQLGQHKRYLQAVRRPLEYALYLANQIEEQELAQAQARSQY